ncbi:integrin alpha-PS2 isoform X1 [Drosophila albomicans]|uniref:Integrin alpha-PS2 isoform X1 n=1 Tax=Drosophila albomicans TaxID=7291 RepID=A0A9C6WIK8_DROAB|nr:integrin alpha-PS2 isoform X1 [Drosophila albomicans]XP_051864572.1 integrin alpha-PS2 isoform X1 [Drosophila albomicans]
MNSRWRFAPLALLLTALLLMLLQVTHAYNIDLPSYVRHRHPSNSMFGFSIALHTQRGSYANFNSLIVGAPKYDTSTYQENVKEAGAVFKCTMQDDDCQLVAFDSKGNNRNNKHEIIDRKSYQWLGATVATGRHSDLVVACAPRYVFHTMTPSRALRYDPVGTCFTSHNFKQFNEISPCRTNLWGYHRQGSCQAGFSAAVNSNGSRLFIGAPGSWYWQGQTYSIPPDAEFPFKPPFYQPFGTGGTAISQDVTKPENQVFSTAESTSANDDSYLGYSMITGDFDADRSEDVAIGMPRGANLLGKIVVNRWNMANIFNITGRQIGEYFGYALATSDVDGDGLDDLIIGAPMYTEPGKVEGEYDVGRVYILLQGGNTPAEHWTREHIRDGFHTKGRFGLALSTLGDVNGDGYGDFAVGAPYDGPEGRGVVYIYHGSETGPLAKPSQIIRAEQLVESAPYPHTFGFSLSGGVDMDNNTYPDLAVGAYASDQVYIFRSRPVAAVNAETLFSSTSKLISLDERTCQLQRDHKWVPCMPLSTCWSYTGRYLPMQLDFDVSWLLDAKKTRNPRMFFLRDEGKNIRNQTIRLNYGQRYCLNETVYLMDGVQDKLTPLEVEARYNLRSNRPAESLVRRRRDVLEPVIDQNREIVLRDAINIQKNCGDDNICEPDLHVDVKTIDKYYFGSPEPLTLEVLIKNKYEDAFEAAFYMMTPRDLQFTKLQQLGDKIDMPITCSAPDGNNNFTIKCDIGNPLERNQVTHFAISFVPAEKHTKANSYNFYWEANSTNPDRANSKLDNYGSKSIVIDVRTDLTIKGTSLPDYQVYKAADYKTPENATTEEELGPQVVHIYELRNNQSSFIKGAVVEIYYPYKTLAGDHLMYVLDQPETGGKIRCDRIEANELNLKLNEKQRSKSYLHAQGAISNSVTQESETSGGHLEISDGSNVGVAVSRNIQLNITERQKEVLEREDAQDAAGDASYVHLDRANQADVKQEASNNINRTSATFTHTSFGGGAPSAELMGHSTHGHIQMASPQVYTSSSSSSSSSNYQMPSQQQQQQQQQKIYLAGGGGGYGGALDKSIYGGRNGNFRTGGLDMGINRGNVDNELHNSHNVQYAQQQQQQQQPVVHHRVTYSSSGNRPYFGRENEGIYDGNNQQQNAQDWSTSSSSSSSSSHRFRRELPTPEELRLDESNNTAPCQGINCRVLRCYVENLGYEDADAAFVAIRARMVAKTMEKVAFNAPLNVSTQAIAKVTQLPFIGQPKLEIKKSHEIFYKAQPEPLQVPDVVPLWAVVLSACAGALIFLLLVLLLYKCGFFKRNRPTDHSQERQPLRNGYHGDEHL